MSACKVALALLAVVVATTMAVDVVPRAYVGNNYAAANKSHHLVVGYRIAGDRLILRQNVSKPSSWLQIVTHQQTFNTTVYQPWITQVAAYDQKTDGKGAYASVVSGGPGYKNVTLRFKSQRSHGINFVVEIYAR